MRRSGRCLLCCATALWPAYVAAQEVQRPSHRQVITSADIRAAGVRYLGDALALIDGWDVNSIDAFTWQLSPRGLSSLEQPTWMVVLDGQPIDLDIFGVRSLSRVPVTLGQIDSIEVITAPGLVDGLFAPGGMLRIHTHRPQGTSLDALAFSTNETGDPGPYRFTELATPNIDRIGSGLSGQISQGGTTTFVTVAAAWQEHFVSDPQIRVRNLDISATNYPIIQETLASLSAGYAAAHGRHRVYLGHSSLRDYFFLKPFGREIPVESALTHAGLNGEFELSPNLDLRYRLIYSRNALDEHPNSLDIDFDWKERRWYGQVFLDRQRGSLSARLGASLEMRSAETAYQLQDERITLAGLQGELRHALAPTLMQRLAFQVSHAGADPGFELTLAHRWQTQPVHAVELALSYLERIPENDRRIWFWDRRGYDFLADNGVDASLPGDLGEARTIAGDLSWAARLSPRLSARLGAYLRAFSGLAIEEQRYQFDPVTRAVSGSVILSNDRDGALAGADVGLIWLPLGPTGRTRIRSFYRYQASLSGDRVFEQSWRTIPEHRLSLHASHAPWPGFTIWARLRYRSATHWADYRDIAAQSAGAYDSRVRDALSVDIGAQKWFWHRRLRAHVLLQDILNEAVPLHPIGAAFGLSLAVQAELVLGNR